MATTALLPASTLPRLPPPTDFEAYARAANQFPMLDCEEEQRLARAWRDCQDPDAARALVLSHLRLVVRVVRDHSGYGLPSGDLAQEGTVGLMRAVQKFDPDLGIRLSAYAVRWIEAEVREFIFRNWRLVRLTGTRPLRRLFFNYRKTVAALRNWSSGRPVGVRPQDVAKALDLPEDQVRAVEQYFQGQDVSLLSGNHQDEDEDGEGRTARLTLSALPSPLSSQDAWSEDPQASLLASRTAIDELSALHRALATLPERDREILVARRLSDPPEGLKEVGARLGISAERVRQLEERAFANLARAVREALPAHVEEQGS